MSQQELEQGLGTLIASQNKLLERLSNGETDGFKENNEGNLVPIPYPDSLGIFPATDGTEGVIEFRLKEGIARVPGVGRHTNRFNTLESLEEDNARSMTFFTDTPISLEFVDASGKVTGRYDAPQAGTYNVTQIQASLVKVESSFPFLLAAVFGTMSETPVDVDVHLAEMPRLGHLDTTDETTTVPFIPLINPTSRITDDYKSDTVNGAINRFGRPILPTQSSEISKWVVSNNGTNDVDIQVLGFDQEDERAVADTGVHTDTSITNFKTVASGNAKIFESSVPFKFRQVRVTNAVAGDDSSTRIQYLGRT